MILVGRHTDEFRFGKGERAKRLRLLNQDFVRFRRGRVDTMHARLITMHRIENDLSMIYGQRERERVDLEREKRARGAYMSIFVQKVICQFQLVERDDIFHPGRTRLRRIGMNVKAARTMRIGFSGDHPARANGKGEKGMRLSFLSSRHGRLPIERIAIAFIVQWNKINHEQVRRRRIHAVDFHL